MLKYKPKGNGMKKKLLVLLTSLNVLAISLTACSKKTADNNTNTEKETPGYNLKFNSVIATGEEIEYKVPFSYLSFNNNGTVFSDELALVSFAFTVNCSKKEQINNVYNAFGFDNVFNSTDYDQDETKDSIKYTIGHKLLNGFDVIGVSLNGISYLKPWESNFVVGDNGNHAGFQSGANIVLTGLKNYLTSYPNTETRKIWINGYSRSAAIGDIVSYSLIDENLVKEDNLFAYLFETPKGVDITNAKEYKSIFNIINSGDVVTYVAPTEYGFKRAGIDVDIYSANTDTILKTFNNKFVLNTFTPSQGKYTNESQMIQYVIQQLMTKGQEPEDPEEIIRDLSSRINYAEFYQEASSYLVGLFMTFKPKTIAALKTAFDSLSGLAMLALLSENGLYNFMKPILDEYKQEYDDELLKSSLNKALEIIKLAPNLMTLVMSEQGRASLMRTMQLHSPDVVFPLLLNYIKQ